MKNGFAAISVCVALSAAAALFVMRPRESPAEGALRVTEARIRGFPHAELKKVTKERRAQLARQYLRRGGSAAVADLLAGDVNRSISELTSAAAADPRNANTWNDLAAAYYERSRSSGSAEDLLHSLAAAHRALDRDPASPEASFNLAVALETLGLRTAARSAYIEYLQHENSGPWADEAHKRLNRTGVITDADEWRSAMPRLENACLNGNSEQVLTIVRRFTQPARTWAEGLYLAQWADAFTKREATSQRWFELSRCVGDALQATTGDHLLIEAVRPIGDREQTEAKKNVLATAHMTYRAARIAYSKRQLDDAERSMKTAEALFTDARSPFALVSEFYTGCIAYDKGDVNRALSILDDTASRTPSRYRSLCAQIEYERSLALGAGGHVHAALAADMSSMNDFEAIHEMSNAARAGIGVATLMVALGRPGDAWQLRAILFPQISQLGDTALLQSAVGAAAGDEVLIGRWDTAAVLYREFAETRGMSPIWRTDALVWHAVATARTNDLPSAEKLLQTASAAASEISDYNLRQSAIDDIRFAGALITLQEDPRRAEEALTATIEYRTKKLLTSLLPQALVTRAKAFRAEGNETAAIADVKQAIKILETESPAPYYNLRERFFGAAGDVFDLAIDLAATRGDAADVFELSEQARQRAQFSPTENVPAHLSLQACAAQLPPHVALLHLSALEQTLVAITVSNSVARIDRIPVPRAEIESLTGKLATAAEHDDEKSFANVMKRLSETVFAPLAAQLNASEKIIVAADDATARIPFAALTGLDRVPLVETHTVEMTPSAAIYFRHAAAARPPRIATVIGDPAFDQKQFPRLERLPEARTEAREIAAIYSTTARVDSNATKQAFVHDCEDADLVHIAAHTVTDGPDPSLYAIPLASGTTGDNLLYLRDIANLHLHRCPVVVLAGCRTSAASNAGRPIHTFALAFQAAGARAVVGTLWNISDDATRPFAVAFHRSLRSGSSPGTALHEAQLAMIRSPEATERSAIRWGAFQVYSSKE